MRQPLARVPAGASVPKGATAQPAEAGPALPAPGGPRPVHDISRVPIAAPAGGVVQRVLTINAGARKGDYETAGGGATKTLIKDTDSAIGKELKDGWRAYVKRLADRDEPRTTFATTEDYYQDLRDGYPLVVKTGGKTRPNFSTTAYSLAKVTYGLQTGKNQSGLKPSQKDLAMPHRFPYSGIERSVALYISGKEDDTDLERWTDRLYQATVERETLNLQQITGKTQRDWYINAVREQLDELKNAVAALEQAKGKGETLDLYSTVVQRMLKAANNMHGNIPDYGPHTTVNIPVSNRIHVHVERPSDWDEDDDSMKAPLSPGSNYAMMMSPQRVPKGVAFDDEGSYLVGTDGRWIDPERVMGFDDMMDEHTKGYTTIDSSNLNDF